MVSIGAGERNGIAIMCIRQEAVALWINAGAERPGSRGAALQLATMLAALVTAGEVGGWPR
jgi:hypothetical protein